MIIRGVFAFLVAFLVLPYVPAPSGLGQDNVAQLLSTIRDTIATRTARAEADLRENDSVILHRGDGGRFDDHASPASSSGN